MGSLLNACMIFMSLARAVFLRTPTRWSYYITTLLRTPGRSNLLPYNVTTRFSV